MRQQILLSFLDIYLRPIYTIFAWDFQSIPSTSILNLVSRNKKVKMIRTMIMPNPITAIENSVQPWHHWKMSISFFKQKVIRRRLICGFMCWQSGVIENPVCIANHYFGLFPITITAVAWLNMYISLFISLFIIISLKKYDHNYKEWVGMQL